tara:strand:+ start:58 stop:2250 length:2193 start_codon:yes stop_codon:yes gene_type:complete
MAEEKPTRDYSPFLANYPIDLLKYPYTDGTDYELKPEPVVSPGQVAWFGAQILPTAAGIDTAGKMPGPPSYEQPISEFMSGEPMPSMAKNIETGGIGGYFGAAMQGLGNVGDAMLAVPWLAPVAGSLKALSTAGKVAKNLIPTVQKTQRLRTDRSGVEKALDPPGGIAGFLGSERTDIFSSRSKLDTERLKVDGPQIQLNAERFIIDNPQYTNPNKKYSVDQVVESTIAQAGKKGSGLEQTVKDQFARYISPNLRGSKATLQEILDDIGKNKPTIRENYSSTDNVSGYQKNYQGEQVADRDSVYARLMPSIGEPVGGDARLNMNRYTERSYSIDDPTSSATWRDPGHVEVSGGNLSARMKDIKPEQVGDPANAQNRIFTSRAGLYDNDGVPTYVAAEGQSGIYGMTDSVTEAQKSVRSQMTRLNDEPSESLQTSLRNMINDPEDMHISLQNPGPSRIVPDEQNAATLSYEVDSMPSSQNFLDTLTKNGYDIEDWNVIARNHKMDLQQKMLTTLQQHVGTKPFGPRVNHMNLQFNEFMNRTQQVVEELQEAARGTAGQESSQVLYAGDDLAFDLDLARHDSYEKYGPMYQEMFSAEDLTIPRDLDTPFLREWFPLHMKTSINDAVEQGAEVIRFPMNDVSIQPATGAELNSSTVQGLGKIYPKKTNAGIKRIEAEYDIKLNPELVTDAPEFGHGADFLEIKLTPEIKKAFKVLVYNRGGAVIKKPLMNLRY